MVVYKPSVADGNSSLTDELSGLSRFIAPACRCSISASFAAIRGQLGVRTFYRSKPVRSRVFLGIEGTRRTGQVPGMWNITKLEGGVLSIVLAARALLFFPGQAKYSISG